MNPATPIASNLDEIRQSLLGAWSVDRRASRGEIRFVRVTFYRDGRFGTLAVDGRTVVYGNWRIGPESLATADGTQSRGTLALRFDHPGPGGDFHLVSGPDGGALLLVDATSGSTRILLARSAAISAALIGTWRAAPGPMFRGEHALDSLELRRDGTFGMRIQGGVVRVGRWGFDRAGCDFAGGVFTGVLVLDPTEIVFPVLRWNLARAGTREIPSLRIKVAEALPELTLLRPVLDPSARVLVANWRLVAPNVKGVPQELSFRGDGSVEILARAGTTRNPGQWSFKRSLPARREALEGLLALAIHPPGQPTVREQWRIVLPFERNAELEFRTPTGAPALRYRRLFR